LPKNLTTSSNITNGRFCCLFFWRVRFGILDMSAVGYGKRTEGTQGPRATPKMACSRARAYGNTEKENSATKTLAPPARLIWAISSQHDVDAFVHDPVVQIFEHLISINTLTQAFGDGGGEGLSNSFANGVHSSLEGGHDDELEGRDRHIGDPTRGGGGSAYVSLKLSPMFG